MRQKVKCAYHPNLAAAGLCDNCKAGYCEQCAVPHPGNEAEVLCLDCGAALNLRRLFQSVMCGLGGFILGMGLVALAHWPTASPAKTAFFAGYGAWSIFWGWQYGNRLWSHVFQLFAGLPGAPATSTLLLLLLRLPVAVVVGAGGGGMVLMAQAVRLLLYRRMEHGKCLQNSGARGALS